MMSTNGSPAPAVLESTWSQNQRHYQTGGLLEMLTRKQYELLRFINERLKEAGVPPSFDEMKDALDLRSKSGIHRLITALEERRVIRRLPNRARAIEVIKLPEVSAGGSGNSRRGFTPSVIEGNLGKVRGGADDGERPVSVPVMGRIAAGTPIEALQTRSHTISVPPDMLGSGEHYALEVRGDSMVDAGILDGDMALISATTISPVSAVSLRWISAMSPSRMPASDRKSTRLNSS